MFRKDGNLPWKINVVAGTAEVCGAAPCLPIGQIQTASGFVTVTRAGGIVVTVKPGDFVHQGEVIETGADGAVGITFTDGTSFSLSASARMALDEFVCDPNGAANSALFTLTRGTFAFIAGKLAKAGSLRIDTPLASIQGRAQGRGFGILTLAALTFSVMQESHAEGPGPDADWLEDDAIELDHSAFTVTTHEATPRTLEVKDLDRALVISLKGSTISVDYVSLSPAQVAANARFSNEVATQQQAGFSLRPTDVTGTGGSSYGTFAFSPSYTPPTTIQTASLTTTTTTTTQSGASSTSGISITLPPTIATSIQDVTITIIKPGALQWLGPSGAQFANGNFHDFDWSVPGQVSGANDDAILINHTNPYTVAVTDNQAVHSLTLLVDTATLDVVAGASLTVGSGSGTAIDNAGLLEVTGGGALDIKGAITNDLGGTISARGETHISTVTLEGDVTNNGQLVANGHGVLDFIAANGNTRVLSNTQTPDGIVVAANGTLQFEVATLELTGSGGVLLTGGTITGTGSNTFDNDGNNIAGYGSITKLALQNEGGGIIDANVSGQTLTIQTGNTISNAGLLEATAGGILQIDDNVTNTGGTLKATGGGELDVKSTTITDNSGGTKQIDTGSELLVDNAHLTLNGDGTGQVKLAGTGLITGAAKTNELENVNKTISGAGTISNLTLVNDSAGVIDASGLLVLNTGNTISNAGLLEATAGGILQIDDNVTNTGGTLKATGGGELDVKSTTITDNSGGTKQIDTGSELLVDNAHLTLNGDGTGQVKLAGTGLITAAAKTNELENVNKTISGAGTISNLTLVNDSAGVIDASGLLVLNTGNTISNAGLLEATAGGILQIDDNVTNTGGTLKATGGGELDVKSTTITDNSGGTVQTDAKSGATPGGEIDSSGTSSILSAQVNNFGTLDVESGTLTLSSDTVNNTGGLIDVDTGAALTLSSDSITNTSGTVDANAGATIALTASSITGGTVQTDAKSGATPGGEIDSSGTSSILSAQVNNFGTLDVENGTLTLSSDTVNNTGGLIDVDTGAALTLSSDSITNTSGTVDANAGATIALTASSITGGTVQTDAKSGATPGGEIDSSGTSSILSAQVNNFGTLDVENGTLTLSSDTVNNTGGLIDVDTGAALTLSSDSITNTSGTVDANAGATIALTASSITGGTVQTDAKSGATPGGEIDSSGTSSISSAQINNFGTLDVETGTLTLSSDTVNNTGGLITVDNLGQLNLSGVDTISGGQLTVESGGQLAITPTASATFDNVVVTDDTTSTTAVGIDVASGAVLTLDGGTQIVGNGTGTLTIDSSGQLVITTPIGATLNGVIVDDDTTSLSPPGIDVASGVLKLTGGTQIWGGGTGTLTVESNGELQIIGSGAALDGMQVTDGNNAGTGIDVSGATLTLEDETVISGGTLTVESTGELLITAGLDVDGATPGGATFDAVTVTDNNNTAAGIDVASGAVLKLNDGTTISGGTMNLAGTLEVDNGATNDISHVTVTDVGNTSKIVVTGGTLTLDHVSFSGSLITIIVDPGATLNIDHSFIADAEIENFGGTLNVTADSTIQTVQSGLSGHNTVQSGATLTLIDENVTGTIDDQGTILVQTAGASPNGAVFDGVIVDDDTTTLSPPGIDVASGATLTLKNNTQIQGGGTGTLTIESGGQLAIITAGGATLDGLLVTDNNTIDGIDVGPNAVLTLNDGTAISGGTLTVESTGKLLIAAGSGVESSAVDVFDLVADSPSGRGATLEGMTVTNTGNTEVISGGTLTLLNDFVNNSGTGVITVDNGGTLNLGGNDTISGGQLANASGGKIFASGGKNTIESDSFTNAGSTEVSGTLTLSSDTVNNTGGLIDVDTGAALTLSSDSITNTSGTVDANAGATIALTASSITGGTVQTDAKSGATPGGEIDSSGTSSILSAQVNNQGTLDVENGTLTLSSDTVNNTGGLIDVDTGAALTLSSDSITNTSGTVDANAGATIALTASSITGGTVQTDAKSGATPGGEIDSSGTSSILSAQVNNQGTLDVENGTLTLSSDTVNNTGGLIDVDTGAALTLSSDSITNTSGTVDANAGATIALTASSITGGTVQTDAKSGATPGGEIDSSGTSSILSAQVNNQGTLDVENGTLTLLSDTVNNTGGLIDVDTGAALTLSSDSITNTSGTVDANAGATIALTASSITGGTVQTDAKSGATPGGEIDSSGTSSILSAQVNNQGTLDVENGTLTLSSDTVNNTGGLIDVDTGAALTLSSNSITNTSGTVDANAGATIALTASSITGGTVQTDAKSGATPGGEIDSSGTSSILSAQVNNFGTLDVENGTLTLSSDTVNNTGGLIDVDTGAALTLSSDSITNTSGTVDANAGATIALTASSITGGTVQTDAKSGATPGGEIDSSGTSSILSAQVNNQGTLDVENGTLTLSSDTVNNSGGLIDVDTGAALTLSSDSITNTSGTVDANAGATIALTASSITGGTVQTDAKSGATPGGEIDSSGTSSILSAQVNNQGTLDVENGTLTLLSDTVNNSGGLIDVDTGAALTLSSDSITNTSGTVDANAGATIALTASSITGGTITDNGTIIGTGTVTGSTSGSGTVTASGGTLELNITSVGTLQVGSASGDTLKLDGVSSATLLTFLGSTGTLELNTAGTLTVTSALATGANTLKLDGASSNLTDAAGVSLTTGNITGQGKVAAAVTATGAATITANGGLLELSSVANSGAALALKLGTSAGSSGDTLKLDGTSSATSASFVGTSGETLEIAAGTLTLTNALAIGADTLKLDNASSSLTDAAGVSLTTGNITGQGKVAAAVTATGAATITANGGLLELSSVANGGGGAALALKLGTSGGSSGDTLKLDSTSSATSVSFVGTSGETLEIAAGMLTLTNALAIGADTLQLDSASSNLTDAAGVSLTTGNITGQGKVAAAVTATGAATITANGGLLELSSVANGGGGAALALKVGTSAGSSGDTLKLDSTSSATSVSFVGTSGETLEIAAGMLTLTNALAIGADTLQLDSASSNLTDAAGVSLTTGNITGRGKVAAAVTPSGPAHVTASGGTLEMNGTITNNGSLALTVGSDASDKLLLDAASAATSLTFSGATGTLEVNTSGVLTLANVLTVSSGATVKLDSGSQLTDTSGITINGTGKLTGAGTVTAGTTATTDVDGTGSITASSGTLEFKTQVDGTSTTAFDIATVAGSVLKFDAAVGTSSINPVITFDGTDSGHGVLDLTSISLSSFHGKVANFDEGKSIKVTNATRAALDTSGTVLTVYNGSSSLGTITFTTSYTGDTFNVSNSVITVNDLAVTLSGLSGGSTGIPIQGQAVSVATVSDDGSGVASGLNYQWYLDGAQISGATSSSYTPKVSDENHVLSVTVTYASDPAGSESTTISAGAVASIVVSGSGTQTFNSNTNNQSIAVTGSNVTVNFGAPGGTTNTDDNVNTVTVTGTNVTLNFNGEDNNHSNRVILGPGTDFVTLAGDTNNNGNTVVLGSGQDTITFASRLDPGGTSNNNIVKAAANTVSTPAAPDTINNFNTTDTIDLSAITQLTSFLTPQLSSQTANVKPGYVAWFDDTTHHITYVYGNTSSSNEAGGSTNFELKLTGDISLTSSNFSGLTTVSSPAGIAGSPINLALHDQAAAGTLTTVTVGYLPTHWSLSEGTQNPDGTWSVQANDPSTLTVTTPATFSGAVVLNVTESWTNPDGSSGTGVIADNVEAYAPGSPIFALSGDDNLTGAGGNDLFVFAQPIGHDTIYNFNPATDTVDLIGVAGIGSFSDIQANVADDANGNAVITIGPDETITLHGVHAASLTASDFVFDQTPVTNNAGSMMISDGAMLPLSGTINNTGTIAVNSTGDETDLQLVQHGITLQGGGQIILSDSSANVISGTDPSVTLTNVDNTISGAGHLGDGQLTLLNEGTIIADGSNALVIDTGANIIVNSGTLQSTGSGGLVIYSDVSNSGLLRADGGNLTVHGNVSGAGSAIIDGSAVLEVTGADSSSVIFHSTTGELIVDNSASFTGTISGFTGDGTLAGSDHIDLKDINFNSLESAQLDANGVLTVSDGMETANLHFDGSYQLANFKFADDGHGGTLVYDPPVSPATATSPVGNPDKIVTGSPTNATLAGNGGGDAFVFKPNFGQDAITNFKPPTDVIAIDHTTFDGIQHILDATTHVDAHAVIAADAGTTITLDNVIKNQLLQHPNDFHFL